MLYLLDANVLIDANRRYYRRSSVPEFWDWLVHLGQESIVKIPREVAAEVKDDLAPWLKEDRVVDALSLKEEPDPAKVQEVHDAYAQGKPLDDIELEKIPVDPLLISYALPPDGSRAIVTTEVSKPTLTRANRKIPDVCADLGIECVDTFELTKRYDFRTDWEEIWAPPDRKDLGWDHT